MQNFECEKTPFFNLMLIDCLMIICIPITPNSLCLGEELPSRTCSYQLGTDFELTLTSFFHSLEKWYTMVYPIVRNIHFFFLQMARFNSLADRGPYF